MATFQPKEKVFKTLILGDSSVGKTCLAKLFEEEEVVRNAEYTIGLDYVVKDVKLKDGTLVKVQIWDTQGTERFKAFNTICYHNTHGVVLVYDITIMNSFSNLEKWINEIKHYCNLESVQMVLIGNKLDKEHDRKVPTEAGQKFADRYGMPTFVEMSAMSIDNLPLLEKALTVLAQSMFDESLKRAKNLGASEWVVSLNAYEDSGVKKSKPRQNESSCC